MAIDITNQAERASLLEYITNDEENLSRKREAQRRFDIYQDRQAKYVEEILSTDLSAETIRSMRKVLSINLSKKIINDQASLYEQEPDRSFTNASDAESDLITRLYESSKVDSSMRWANRYFKLHHQILLMVMPSSGKLRVRPLQPFHYDVIPMAGQPEVADTVILNAWDFDLHKTTRQRYNRVDNSYTSESDRVNEPNADPDDRLALNQRFIFWRNDFVFETDGKGNITSQPEVNPIGRLPFIDISIEKDFQYFVRRGQNVTDFTLDFLVQLSDAVETARLSAYSQAIIKSEKPPRDLKVGPQVILWLPIDPNRPEASPSFEYASPNPNISSNLELMEAQVKMLLSAEGLDASAITAKGQGQQFTSATDRLLAMLDRFRASQADMDVFRWAEGELFDLLRAWSNALQPVNGEGALDDAIKGPQISDKVDLNIKYAEPQAVETPEQIRESVRDQLELGLMSKREAVKILRDVDEDRAEEILGEIALEMAPQLEEDNG